MNIAEQVRAEMERQNLSARKLAARVGMKPDTVLDFIHNRRATRRSVKLSICRELGLNYDQKGHAA